MLLTIPYSHTTMNLSTNHKGDIQLNISGDSIAHLLVKDLMDQISYEDFINIIGPEEFEKIAEFYKIEYTN